MGVFLSGHGAFVKDRSGDEEDGKDETLIPTDYRTAGQIKDDEIFEEVRGVKDVMRLEWRKARPKSYSCTQSLDAMVVCPRCL